MQKGPVGRRGGLQTLPADVCRRGFFGPAPCSAPGLPRALAAALCLAAGAASSSSSSSSVAAGLVLRATSLAAALSLAGAASAGPAASDCAGSTYSAPLTRPCSGFEAWAGLSPPRASCPCPGRSALAPTKTFSLNVSSIIVNNPVLAGVSATKMYIAANGTVPGPAIVVDEGDWVEVTVTNALDVEPTTLHWHGMLQVLTPYSDGVPSISQCAIQPGASMTYSFRASNAGTYWYHGHLLEQYVDGLIGPLIVRALPGAPDEPPAHTDEVTLLLADFHSDSAHKLLTSYYLTPLSGGAEPVPDAITVNGRFSATVPGGAPSDVFAAGVASRTGKTLFRVVAANAFSMFSVAIDGVNLQLVELDATAVAPLTVPSVTLNVGQRAAFIVDWSTLPAAYNATPAVYLRVEAMSEMYPFNISDASSYPAYATVDAGWQPLDPDFEGILYFGAAPAAPSYSPLAPPPAPAPAIVNTGAYAGVDVTALDTNMLAARPVVAIPAPAPTHQMYLEIAFQSDANGINRAYFNGISHAHDMSIGMTPALYRQTGLFDASLRAPEAPAALTQSAAAPPGYAAGAPPPAAAVPYSPDAHYVLPPGGTVVVLINNTDGGEHPIHVHGHAFFVVASSAVPAAEGAYASNPARRDVVSVEAGGWVKIVFTADNAGVWALHCHIDWHLAAGLMIELYENLPALDGLAIPASHLGACAFPPGVTTSPGAAAAAATASGASPTVIGLGVALGVALMVLLNVGALALLRGGCRPARAAAVAPAPAPAPEPEPAPAKSLNAHRSDGKLRGVTSTDYSAAASFASRAGGAGADDAPSNADSMTLADSTDATCGNPGCDSPSRFSADVACEGCHGIKYCSTACRHVDQMRHRPACVVAAAARDAARARPVAPDAALLFHAVLLGSHKRVDELLRLGADAGTPDRHGLAPLHYAAREGNAAIARALLGARPACVGAADNHGSTPLHVAALAGHADVARVLLAAPGVAANAANVNGFTPLMCAAAAGHSAVARELIAARGVELHAADKFGRTVMHYAAIKGLVDVVRALLASPGGAAELCHEADADGRTPLHYAALKGHAAVVRALLASRAVERGALDKHGSSPLALARRARQAAVVALLESVGEEAAAAE